MKRIQKITYKPGDRKEKPMIRISNRYLRQYGFDVGGRIEIEYADGAITIRKQPKP